MTITLLIIEDEVEIRDMIRFSLSPDEYDLVDAEHTKQAYRLLANKIPDLILLDWMLPGQSGIDFINAIKKQDYLKDIPIIMLTAKAEEENKIKGLTTGADDYITKPFSPNELIARIKSVLRRGTITSPNNEIKYREITLNLNTNQVQIQNNIINLTPTEYKLLVFFLKRPNKTYTRDKLITHIWGGNVYIDDRTVDVQIRRLRMKLKPYCYHQIIKTIRGIGYQFSQEDCDGK